MSRTVVWFKRKIVRMRTTKPHSSQWYAGRLGISVGYARKLLRELWEAGVLQRRQRDVVAGRLPYEYERAV